MFRAQMTSPEPASLFSSGRTSNGRSGGIQNPGASKTVPGYPEPQKS